MKHPSISMASPNSGTLYANRKTRLTSNIAGPDVMLQIQRPFVAKCAALQTAQKTDHISNHPKAAAAQSKSAHRRCQTCQLLRQ